MAGCTLCHGLQKGDDPSYPRLALEFAPAKLTQSIHLWACATCSLILASIKKFESPSWTLSSDIRKVCIYGLSSRHPNESLTIELYFTNDDPKILLELFWPEKSTFTNLCNAIKPKPSIRGHPLKQKSLDWVASLLDDCLQRHENCPSAGIVQLPHRILAFEQSMGGCITVKLKQGESTPSRYATLSHCWRSQSSFTTTTQNIDERMKGILWETIPKTFQDSILYCLKLGIAYLWIDALCIIQDDISDWQLESAKMADIYQNSYITLAATAAENESAGCFPAVPTNVQEHKVEFSSRTRHSQVLVRRKLHHWATPATEASMRRNPLISRGWVFQERILSPRTLHFGDEEIIWECGSGTWCECGGMGTDPSVKQRFASILRAHELVEPEEEHEKKLDDCQNEMGSSKPPAYSVNPITCQIDSGMNSLRLSKSSNNVSSHSQIRERNPEDWRRVVEEYSALRLTKPTDCLPALSGLAQRTALNYNTYHGGLWSDSLHADLLWRVEKLELGTTRPPVYRGPTWSWVSTTSRVKYWTQNELSSFSPREISQPNLYCVTDRASANTFGEIRSSKLVTTALTVYSTLKYISFLVGTHGIDLRSEHDPLRYEIVFRHDRLGRMEFPFYPDYVLSAEGDHHVPDKSDLLLLIVCPDVALVLRRAPTTEGYERIGIFKASPRIFEIYGVDLLSNHSTKSLVVT